MRTGKNEVVRRIEIQRATDIEREKRNLFLGLPIIDALAKRNQTKPDSYNIILKWYG